MPTPSASAASAQRDLNRIVRLLVIGRAAVENRINPRRSVLGLPPGPSGSRYRTPHGSENNSRWRRKKVSHFGKSAIGNVPDQTSLVRVKVPAAESYIAFVAIGSV